MEEKTGLIAWLDAHGWDRPARTASVIVAIAVVLGGGIAMAVNLQDQRKADVGESAQTPFGGFVTIEGTTTGPSPDITTGSQDSCTGVDTLAWVHEGTEIQITGLNGEVLARGVLGPGAMRPPRSGSSQQRCSFPYATSPSTLPDRNGYGVVFPGTGRNQPVSDSSMTRGITWAGVSIVRDASVTYRVVVWGGR